MQYPFFLKIFLLLLLFLFHFFFYINHANQGKSMMQEHEPAIE